MKKPLLPVFLELQKWFRCKLFFLKPFYNNILNICILLAIFIFKFKERKNTLMIIILIILLYIFSIKLTHFFCSAFLVLLVFWFLYYRAIETPPPGRRLTEPFYKCTGRAELPHPRTPLRSMHCAQGRALPVARTLPAPKTIEVRSSH